MDEEQKDSVPKDIQRHPAFISATAENHAYLRILTRKPKKGCKQVSETVSGSVWKSGTGICRIYPGIVYGSKQEVDGKMKRRG